MNAQRISDSGSYRCIAHNRGGSQHIDITVSIKGQYFRHLNSRQHRPLVNYIYINSQLYFNQIYILLSETAYTFISIKERSRKVIMDSFNYLN